MPHLVWDETEIRQGQPRLKRADEPRKPHRTGCWWRTRASVHSSASGLNDNLLVHGDNLEALQSLLPYYAGQVKCIFIDPPYNTGSAFTHYDDGIEHSAWLSMMLPRLKLLREFLRPDGSIWVTIDDREGYYLKVLCDQVFGRANFVSSIAWQKAFAKKNKALISGSHDHLFVIARNKDLWTRNLLPRSADKAFKNPDEDLRGKWQSVAYSVQSEDAEKRMAYRYEISFAEWQGSITPTRKTLEWDAGAVSAASCRQSTLVRQERG